MKWTDDIAAAVRGGRHGPPAPPFQGTDRDGLPTDLLSAETSALRSLSPRRNRWPEVARFDERVAELQSRQARVTATLGELREKLRLAPAADRDALAVWLATGERGSRPEPTAKPIEEEVAKREADYDALTRATATVLEEKATYVERHRKKLVQGADHSTEAAHRHVVDLIDQLAAAREQLADHREAAIWAAVYPDAAAGSALPRALLAGGLQRPVAEALGISAQVRADALFRVLRADADFIKTAATRQQRELVNGKADPNLRNEGLWLDSDEGREAQGVEREKREAALARARGIGGGEMGVGA